MNARLTAALLWLWVSSVAAAYGFQFRHLAHPILDALGLA
jgi:hypothetical protein